MKNGDSGHNDLTEMIDGKIAALEAELAKWRDHRNHILHVRKDLGILENQPPAPITESPLKYAEMGLTDAVKAFLKENGQYMYSVPEVRDGLIEGGIDASGKNFYVILGQTLNRLAKNPSIVAVTDHEGKKHFSAGKELL